MSTEINGIPVETFDPSKHLVECREITEGRTVFVTLQSLMEAEDVIDAQAAPQTALDLPAIEAGLKQILEDSTQGFVRPDQLAELEERIIKNVRESIPPAQFPADIMQTFADITAALIATNKRIEELERTVATHTGNFVAIMSMAGGGE